MSRNFAIFGFLMCVFLIILAIFIGMYMDNNPHISVYVHPERASYLLLSIIVVAGLLLIAFGYVNFFSLMVLLLIKIDPSYSIIRRSGSPFHYLVWEDIREKIEANVSAD